MSREVGVEPGGRRRRPYYRLSPWDNRTRGEGRAAASFMRHAQRRAGECQKMARTTRQDTVRELQRTLYRAAKADRWDVLGRAWGLVRASRGAAGVDRTTIQDVERYGVDRLLDELAAGLKD